MAKITNVTFDQANEFCRLYATREQVHALWATLKQRNSAIDQEATVGFRVGEDVAFVARNHTSYKGVVKSINRRTVTVFRCQMMIGGKWESTHEVWKVAAANLRKVA